MKRLLLLLLVAASVSAQDIPNIERGFATDIDYTASGGPDVINMFNGNVMIGLQLGQQYRVGGDLSYAVKLAYNSKPWDEQLVSYSGATYTQVVPRANSNAGLGWSLNFGKLNGLVYEGPDGSQHQFYTTLHEGDTVAGCCNYTRDGSYMRLVTVGDGTFNIEMPNGTIHHFPGQNSDVDKISDRYGNFVTFTVSHFTDYCYDGTDGGYCVANKTLQINDSLGRNQYIYTQQDDSFATNWYVTHLDLEGFGGSRAVYNFENTAANVARGCSNTDPNVSGYITVALLTKITRPDGTTYQMAMPGAYYTVASPTTCNQGLLAKMSLPTLGSVEWDYQLWNFPNPDGTAGMKYKYSTAGVSARRTKDASGNLLGTWTYATQLVTPTGALYPREMVNTVTDPSRETINGVVTPGVQTKHYFSVFISQDTGANTDGWSKYEYNLPFTRNPAHPAQSGRYLSAEIYDNGRLVRRRYVTYERDQAAISGTHSIYDTNRRLLKERIIYDDDGARYADRDHSNFDGLGHYRQTALGGTFDAGNARTSWRNYNPSLGTLSFDAGNNYTRLAGYTMFASTNPWVINTFTDTRETDASSQQRQYCFDAATGFLLRERRESTTLQGGLPGTNDAIMTRDHDGTGNVSSERWYGGDTQALGTGDLCTLVLGTEQLRLDTAWNAGTVMSRQYVDQAGTPLSYKLLDRDIDNSTGAVTTARDNAGYPTTYTYDAMGRLLTASPTFGAKVQYTYTNATGPTALATIDEKTLTNNGSTVLTDTQTVLDEFSRVQKERTLTPGGAWSTRLLRYNALGWPTFLSERDGSAAPTTGTTYSHFDPFGRATWVTTADNKTTTFTFSGDRISTHNASVNPSNNASTTTTAYDRQGRVYQVTEMSGASGANTTTQYAYYPDGALRSVTTGTQSRTFTRDGRGFLTSEHHPEQTSDTTYGQYTAFGVPTTRSEGNVTTTTTYDRARRPVTISSGGRTYKEFAWSTISGWQNGQLDHAIRHNYNTSGADTTVTETYSYGLPDGRLTARDTTESDGYSFHQGFIYDDLGHLVTQYYPSGTAGISSAGPTISYSYTNGALTGIPGYAPTITYYPNGLVQQLTYANNATWTQTNDPNAMTRPASISTTGVTPGFTTGTFQYDASGNITYIGADHFLYDGANRLTEASTVGGTQTRQYQYDTFGNITAATTLINGSLVQTQGYSVDAGTNRSALAGYDTAGNVTLLNAATYTYDPLGMIAAVTSSSKNVRFLYTPGDERIGQLDSNVTWYLRDANGKVATVFAQSGGTWNATHYVYRDGALVGSTNGTATTYYVIDHLGSIREVFDNTGNASSQQSYYAYGEDANACADSLLKFAGQQRDFNCDSYGQGTDNAHAREYSAWFGRFLSVDRHLGNLLRPQSWNRYAYVLDNPTNFVDPNGMEEKKSGQQMNPGDTCAAGSHAEEGWCAPDNEIYVHAPIDSDWDYGSLDWVPFMGGGIGIPVVPIDPLRAQLFVRDFKNEFKDRGCVGVFLNATGDALNPFTPSLSTAADPAVAAAAAFKYNAVLAYAASRPNFLGGTGLIYPMKSSVVRSMLEEAGEVAEAGPFLALDLAIAQGLFAEFRSMAAGECQ